MKVLISEDDASSRRVIKTNLERWGYEVIVTENGQEAWNILGGNDSPSLAVLDWVMPEMDGIEVCRRVRELAREPYTYIILLTSKGQKDEIVEGLECGADDYVVKPFHPHELRVRLRAGERIVVLQEQVITARERLREMATKDALTGVLNRGAIMEVLHKEMSRAVRARTSIHVCMLDIDHFKSVNDTHGHAIGDVVLKETAARISSAVRTYDSVGRYGGEEFLIILPGGASDAAQSVGERIRMRISESQIIADGNVLGVTVSIGLFSVEVATDTNVEPLLQAADNALYEAKRNGRNRLIGVRSDDGNEPKPATVSGQ